MSDLIRLDFSSGLGALLRQLPAILSSILVDCSIFMDVVSLMAYCKHGGLGTFSLYLYFCSAGILTVMLHLPLGNIFTSMFSFGFLSLEN